MGLTQDARELARLRAASGPILRLLAKSFRNLNQRADHDSSDSALAMSLPLSPWLIERIDGQGE